MQKAGVWSDKRDFEDNRVELYKFYAQPKKVQEFLYPVYLGQAKCIIEPLKATKDHSFFELLTLGSDILGATSSRMAFQGGAFIDEDKKLLAMIPDFDVMANAWLTTEMAKAERMDSSYGWFYRLFGGWPKMSRVDRVKEMHGYIASRHETVKAIFADEKTARACYQKWMAMPGDTVRNLIALRESAPVCKRFI